MCRLKTRGSDGSDRNMEQYVPLRCKIYKRSRFNTEYKVVAKCVIAGLFSFVKLSLEVKVTQKKISLASKRLRIIWPWSQILLHCAQFYNLSDELLADFTAQFNKLFFYFKSLDVYFIFKWKQGSYYRYEANKRVITIKYFQLIV